MVSPLSRARARPGTLRGRVLAAALVVACGLAAFITMQCARHALERARADWYHDSRLADVFATLKRARVALASDIARIPSVAVVGERARRRRRRCACRGSRNRRPAASCRCRSAASDQRPFARSGRLRSAARRQVLLSETFARQRAAARRSPRRGAGAALARLRVVGLALSPEYVYEVGPATVFPDNRRFGVMWMARVALEAIRPGRRVQRCRWRSRRCRRPAMRERLDRLLAPWGGLASYNP